MNTYCSTNSFNFPHLDFTIKTPWHKIKTIREDFNDMFRAEHEHRKECGDKSIVFVLTYSNESLHKVFGTPVLDYKDLQMFAKSGPYYKAVKQHLGLEFDYVAVGEYGEGGLSHGYVGSRGAGNNPHYHCAGWYHKVADMDQPSTESWLKDVFLSIYDESTAALLAETISHEEAYDIAVNMLRFYWERSLESDPALYAKRAEYKNSRTLGCGYVRLQGEILSAKGGTYISKYIGKAISDGAIKRLYANWDRYAKAYMIAALRRYVYVNHLKCMTHDDEVAIIHEWWHVNTIKSTGMVHAYLTSNIPASTWFTSQSITSTRWFLDNFQSKPDLIIGDNGVLDQAFLHVVGTFFKDVQNRYSPKVRKFHQFGYSLLEGADLEQGTYQIKRDYQVVNRTLPVSLRRFLYYDHAICFYAAGLNKGQKVVVYHLNELGKRHIKSTLPTKIAKDTMLLQQFGRVDCQPLAHQAAVVYHCYFTYDVAMTPQEFDNQLNIGLGSTMAAINYAVECRQQCVFEERVYEQRLFLDVRKYIKEHYPQLYAAVMDLSRLKNDMAAAQDVKSMDFVLGSIKLYYQLY